MAPSCNCCVFEHLGSPRARGRPKSYFFEQLRIPRYSKQVIFKIFALICTLGSVAILDSFVAMDRSGILDRYARASEADGHSCTEKLPWKHDGCQGEMCNCRTGNSLKTEAALYAARSMRSKIISKLKAGTRFKARDLTTVTLAYGTGVIHKFDGGRVDVQIAGKQNDGQYILCGGRLDEDSDTLQVLQESKVEDWARVTLTSGQIGWIRSANLRTSDGHDCEFDPPAN